MIKQDNKLNIIKLATAFSLSAVLVPGIDKVSANSVEYMNGTSDTYTVKRGDTLSNIANQFNLPLNQLTQLNNISNKDIIYIGQVLNVSSQDTGTTSLSVSELFKSQGVLPVDKSLYGITSRFGPRKNPFNNAMTGHHDGLDIATWNINRKDVRSVLPGRVTYAGYHRGGYGNYVRVQHASGVETLYAHMAETPTVRTGDQVSVGQKLGIVGSTGNSTGPHLHLEVLVWGTRVDPEPFMNSLMKNNVPQANKPVQPSNSSVTAMTYIVLPGDSVSKIAQKHKMSIQEIVQLNNMKNANIIYVGQKLIVGKEINETTKETEESIPSNNTGGNNQSSSLNNYHVKSGDTLWSIATSHNLTVPQLKKVNNLNGNIIRVGQKLLTAQNQSGQVTDSQLVTNRTYTVSSGDNLWKIANAHKMSVKKLKEINNLRTDLIFVGDKLTIN